LMIIPITDLEAEFVQSNTPKQLLSLFVEKDVNLFDLGRDSVI